MVGQQHDGTARGGHGRRRGVVAALLVAGLVGLPFVAPASAASPAFSGTLVGPSSAAMYPSGLEYDARLDRIVVADTAGDTIELYARTGEKLGAFGTHGTLEGQLASPRDVAVDGDSNIYVADAENNRIQKFDANGNFLWATRGQGSCNACLNTPIGVTWDAANGVLLVASTGQNLVKAFGPLGAFVWKSPPTGATLDVKQPRDVTRGPDGRIWLSDYHGHRMMAFDVSPDGLTWNSTPAIVLGDGQRNGTGLGQLNYPYNVVFNADATIAYVADTGNGRIARWDISGPTPVPLPQFGRRCTRHPRPCADPPEDTGLFNHLRRVAIDGNGVLFASDFWGGGIEVFDAAGTPIRSIEGASASLPGVSEAYGVDVAPNGHVYVMDRNNHRIEHFDQTGALVGVAGSRGTQAGTFSWPEALAVAPDGRVWVADTRGDRIQRWRADLGTIIDVPSFGGSGTDVGKFKYIEDLDAAPDGRIWIADTHNDRIQVFDPVTETFAAFGSLGDLPGQFRDPRGIAASADAVYVADTLNDRIQKLSLDGTPLLSLGGFTAPEGVDVAPDGTLWVADSGANRIVHLSADLVDLGRSFGGAGTSSRRFNLPHTLAATATRLYVADTYNDRVQVYDLTTDEPAEYVALQPERLLDTRPGTPVGYTGPKPTSDQVVELQVTGTGASQLPADTAAVVLNVTGTEADADGYVTVWPCGQARPATSNLNLVAGATTPNMVISSLGAGGRVCLYTQSPVHLVADLAGHFPSGTGYVAVQPERLLDTRAGGLVGYGGDEPAAHQVVELRVTGVGATRLPADTAAVVLNVTGTEADADGYVTVWPCGEPRPIVSNLNLTAGSTRPNLVISKVGLGGSVCLYTQSATHLVADLAGSFPSASSYAAVQPERLLDTRPGSQVGYTGDRPGADAVVELQVTGVGASRVPVDTDAVVLNVTGTEAAADGYVTVWPCGAPRPMASNLNLTAGATTPNLVVSKVGEGGKVCLYTQSPTHLIADLAGSYDRT